MPHRRRDLVAHHLPSPPLHHEEVGAEHRGILADHVGARRAVEVPPEPRQHLELALHVVGAGRDLAERRAPEHELVTADAQEVRQVGGAVRELQDLERSRDTGQGLGEARAKPRLESGPVEALARADGRDVGAC